MRAQVKLPLLGGCLCSAVRYRITGAPLLVYACHCRDCQTRSGSAFTLPIVLRSADFHVEGGARSVTDETRSGRRVERWACPQCRAPLFARAEAAPAFLSLLAGTLDDTRWVRPVVQVFVDRAMPWAVIDDVAAMDWADFDYEAQGAAWRAGAPQFV